MAFQLSASGAISLAGSTVGRSIQTALNGTGSSQISFNTPGVLALAGKTTATNVVMPTDFYSKIPPTCKAIFAFGNTVIGGTGTPSRVSNLVSTTGVIATDNAGVGLQRNNIAACGYGFDKGIFAFGFSTAVSGVSNLVSDTGVVASDVAAVGTARQGVGATGYGADLGYFFGGVTTTAQNIRNLISNTGVVSTSANATGYQQRAGVTGCRYGTDTGMLFAGSSAVTGGTMYNVYNVVSNAGAIVSQGNVTSGTARQFPGGSSYGFDKGIFQGGNTGAVTGVSNLLGNTGTIAADVAAVTSSVFFGRAGSSYGFSGQGIIGFGNNGTAVSNVASLISNTGVVASGAVSVGTSRQRLGCCGFGIQQA